VTLLRQQLGLIGDHRPSAGHGTRADGVQCSCPHLRLQIKTRKQLLPELTERVKSLHPYDICEVTAVDVTGGSPSYLAWVLDSTKAG